MQLTGVHGAGEVDADEVIAASFADWAQLDARISTARHALAHARGQAAVAEVLGPAQTHEFWAERAAAAEDDLNDLQTMADGTVVGLAVLATRHDTALATLSSLVSAPGDPDLSACQFASEQLSAAETALDQAQTPDLFPVFGADEMPAPMRSGWANVGMVAAAVLGNNSGGPAAWRVSFVDVHAGEELARMTISADAARSPRSQDDLSKAAIAEHVAWTAEHGAGTSADVARALLATLQPVADAA